MDILVNISSSNIYPMGNYKNLLDIKKRIKQVDVTRTPIEPLARVFFDALRAHVKQPDVDLWIFLYSQKIKDRFVSAFNKSNRIDGEIMQRLLNTNKTYRDDYHFFNKVYMKHANVPQKWLDRSSREHSKLLSHFKKEQGIN